jgi:hypothetical protein
VSAALRAVANAVLRVVNAALRVVANAVLRAVSAVLRAASAVLLAANARPRASVDGTVLVPISSLVARAPAAHLARRRVIAVVAMRGRSGVREVRVGVRGAGRAAASESVPVPAAVGAGLGVRTPQVSPLVT